jgi:hypothetical protein
MKTNKTYCATPYKQDVGGSNPSSPTNRKTVSRNFLEPFFLLIHTQCTQNQQKLKTRF